MLYRAKDENQNCGNYEAASLAELMQKIVDSYFGAWSSRYPNIVELEVYNDEDDTLVELNAPEFDGHVYNTIIAREKADGADF